MRKTSDWADDDDFTLSLPAEAEADSAAPSVMNETVQAVEQVEQAPAAIEVDASLIVAGGVPADDVDPSMLMAGGIPSPEHAPQVEQEPALNLQEDPVEQNRQRILRRKRWEALLQPAFWDNAKALLLKKAEQGGLRTEIGISGDTVIFAVKGSGLSALLHPPKITLDLAKGSINASGKGLSAQSLAAAYIECGMAAGYKQMWFEGTPEFMRIATEMARTNGIEVISKSECVVARKLRKLECDEQAPPAPGATAAPAVVQPAEATFDPVEEDMVTRVYR